MPAGVAGLGELVLRILSGVSEVKGDRVTLIEVMDQACGSASPTREIGTGHAR